MSHDPPPCPFQETVECKFDTAGEEKFPSRTTVSFECEPRCDGTGIPLDGTTEVKPASPGLVTGHSKETLLARDSPSPSIKKATRASSPKVQKPHMSSHEGQDLKGSIASPTESSTPKSKKSVSTESSGPKKTDNISLSAEAASSTSSHSEKARKSSKRRKGKKDGATRKERKRGLSTSSSDDPKMPRSRTESAGSETLDVCETVDQEPMTGEGTLERQGCVQNSGGFSSGQHGSDHTSEAVSQYLTTPTETSPTIKSKESTRKKGGKKSDGKKRRQGNRERGLSSSSDDPKSSRSRTVSLGSDVAGCQVAPSKDDAITTTDVLDDDSSAVQGDDSCFVQAPTAPVVHSVDSATGTGPQAVECHISVMDYDFSDC